MKRFAERFFPLAQLLAGHLTRDLFGKCIGWREFEFVFNDLNERMSRRTGSAGAIAAGRVYTVNEVRAMRGLSPLEKNETMQLAGSAEIEQVG